MVDITELSSFKYLVEERKLDSEKLKELANSGKITFQENAIQVPMKDFDGNHIPNKKGNGWSKKIRKTDGSDPKTKNSGPVGPIYFENINFSEPVNLCEGEIDLLVLYKNIPNVVALPSVVHMFGYILELLKRGVPRINLINDNDKPTNTVIQKLLVADHVELAKIYDCRSYYSQFKDVNDCVKSGQEINFEELVGCGTCLSEMEFVIEGGDDLHSLYKELYGSTLSEKHLATLMLQQKVITDCFNFYIFPIRKRVEFDPEALERVVHWDCWAINTSTNRRQKIEINSDSFVEPTSFKKELMKKNGLYSHCTRYAESLQEMKVLFDLSEEYGCIQMIEEITHLGYPKGNDEIIVYSNGKVNLIDKNFIPMKFRNIKSNNEIVFDPTALLGLEEAIHEFKKFITDLTQDGMIRFLLGGFLIAGIWRNEFIEYYKCFPSLYLYGLKHTGKSFLQNLCSSVVGYTNECRYDLSEGTKFTLLEHLGNTTYFTFLDEYKNQKDKGKNEFLKGNYDGLEGKRGTVNKRGSTTQMYTNNSVLVFGGESLSDNWALLERTIYISMYSGATKKLTPTEQKQIIVSGRKAFFSILINKMDVDIPSCIEKAEAIIEDITVESLRLKKNIITIIVGNMILGINDVESLKKMSLEYINLYNSIITAGTTAIDIIHDIENNPHKYLSLSDHIKEGADLPIIIHNNTLLINLRNIVKKYIGNARSEYDIIKLQNELKSILGIEGLSEDKYENYWDFNHNKRKKNLGFDFNEVMENEYLIRIYNVFLSKMMNDITVLKADKFLDEEHAKKVAIVEELVKTPIITDEIKALYDEEKSELRSGEVREDGIEQVEIETDPVL